MGVLIHWIGPTVLLFASLDLFLVLGLFAPCFVIEHNCTRFFKWTWDLNDHLSISPYLHISQELKGHVQRSMVAVEIKRAGTHSPMVFTRFCVISHGLAAMRQCVLWGWSRGLVLLYIRFYIYSTFSYLKRSLWKAIEGGMNEIEGVGSIERGDQQERLIEADPIREESIPWVAR